MATQMAGVNMRLQVGAIRCVSLRFGVIDLAADRTFLRELHWHKIAEVSARTL